MKRIKLLYKHPEKLRFGGNFTAGNVTGSPLNLANVVSLSSFAERSTLPRQAYSSPRITKGLTTVDRWCGLYPNEKEIESSPCLVPYKNPARSGQEKDANRRRRKRRLAD
ncbi:hypothetical protein J6590_049213 [Homalodisca vitripennis]|nr:hypothetical protein J6590_049213 [Homalodisca vitripennis]